MAERSEHLTLIKYRLPLLMLASQRHVLTITETYPVTDYFVTITFRRW